jgi:hypothetical protein
VNNEKWIKNEIDYFTLSKMESKGLSPNEEADKERLLKRVTEDITGLPPSLQAMDDFLNDKSDNAYEKVLTGYYKARLMEKKCGALAGCSALCRQLWLPG